MARYFLIVPSTARTPFDVDLQTAEMRPQSYQHLNNQTRRLKGTTSKFAGHKSTVVYTAYSYD